MRNGIHNMSSVTALALGAMILVLESGCVNPNTHNTRSAALAMPPFATEQLHGSVTDAAVCVGHFWQAFSRRPESGWVVSIGPDEVGVVSTEGWFPLVGVAIEFEDRGGQTFAQAYIQKLRRSEEERRSVTLQAFAACKAPTNNAPSAPASRQIATPVQQTQVNSGTLPPAPRVVGATFGQSAMGIGVLRVGKDGVASRAGLRPGDQITHINGRNIAPLYWENAVALLTTSGSSVSVRLFGQNEDLILSFPN